MLYIKQYLRYIHNIKLLKFSSLCSCCCGGGFATLAALHAGDGFQPLLPKATAAKTTAQEKKSCWILLLPSIPTS